MADAESGSGQEGAGRGRWLGRSINGMIAIGLMATLYVTLASCFKPQAAHADLKSLKTGAMAELMIPDGGAGKPAPVAAFTGPDGQPVHLTDFKGKVVVVNFWATWCGPCVKEMPTLAALAKEFGDGPVKVVTVSVDKTDLDKVVASKIAALPPLSNYRDPRYELLKNIDPFPPGFPTTIVYDKSGVERARMQRDADWSSPEAKKIVAALANEP